MHLAVFSAEGEVPREHAHVRALFAAGLERFHLRKPGWSARDVEQWLAALSPGERARVALHGHAELAQPLGVGALHLRELDLAAAGTPAAAPPGLRLGRACHSLDALRASMGRYDEVVLSCLFPSLSKPGYGGHPAALQEELRRVLEARGPAERRTRVYGLGGVDLARLAECRRLGLDGVAVLGAVWSAVDPCAAYLALAAALGAPARMGAVTAEERA